MLSPIVLAVSMMASAPAPIQVDVGKADWSAMPRLERVERPLPTPAMLDRVHNMLTSSKCRVRGAAPNRFDITVPYAVLVNPDGSAGRVVVGETGCAALESYVGLIVLGLAKQGDFKPSGDGKARWMSSEINFNLDS